MTEKERDRIKKFDWFVFAKILVPILCSVITSLLMTLAVIKY